MRETLEDFYEYRWPIFLAIVLYFQMSWVPGFFHDGYLYAAFGKNAAENGNWLVPHAAPGAYEKFFHHQPLVFILEGLFFKIFGSSYSAARIFSGLFSFATLLILIRFLDKNAKSISKMASYLFILLIPLLKKTRFPSLDLPLMLFVLCAVVSFWNAHEKKEKLSWYLTGLFFGLCLLTKGPMAIFIPLTIALYCLLTKSLKNVLLSIRAWGALLLGLLVFSLWPLSLYWTNQFEIFEKYISFTFIETISKSRGEPSPFYTYILYLLKQCHIWVLFLIIGIVRFKSLENKRIFLLFSSLFMAVLIPLSFAKFKYSHYLIPLYPALAILSAIGLESVLKRKDRFFVSLKFLTVVVILLLVIFPLTTQTRRDKELLFSKEILKGLSIEKGTIWYNVDHAYPYWALHNLNAYESRIRTDNISYQVMISKLKSKENAIFVLSNRSLSKISSLELSGYQVLISFKKRNFSLLVPRSIAKDNTPLLNFN